MSRFLTFLKHFLFLFERFFYIYDDQDHPKVVVRRLEDNNVGVDTDLEVPGGRAGGVQLDNRQLAAVEHIDGDREQLHEQFGPNSDTTAHDLTRYCRYSALYRL